MKASLLVSFALLSCCSIFSQNITSKSKIELNETIEHNVNNTNKLIKENSCSYTNTALTTKTNSITEVSEKNDPKTKVTSNITETIDDSVPRTTIDLF